MSAAGKFSFSGARAQAGFANRILLRFKSLPFWLLHENKYMAGDFVRWVLTRRFHSAALSASKHLFMHRKTSELQPELIYISISTMNVLWDCKLSCQGCAVAGRVSSNQAIGIPRKQALCQRDSLQLNRASKPQLSEKPQERLLLQPSIMNNMFQ